MRTRLLLFTLAFIALSINALASSRAAEWQKVETSAEKGLPKTAIEQLTGILQSALADKAYGEALKAIAYKVECEAAIQGDGPEEKISRLSKELEKSPAEMRPLLETLVAQAYWRYFQINRWNFLNRSTTASAPSADLRTWDLARILSEIDGHFRAALSEASTLRSTPVGDYDVLLTRSTLPDSYRPTLFDFVAYEALEFYALGEQAAVAAEDSYEMPANSPIFDGPAAFLAWRPPSEEGYSPKLRAIALYQALLKFHQGDTTRDAYLEADLARLHYGFNAANAENKTEAYKAALRRFIDNTTEHEISARALASLAKLLNEESEPLQAHELAQRGLKAFPASLGGTQCFNLLNQIEAKSAALNTESVWNAPWPTLNLNYRNLSKVYLRAVPYDFGNYVENCQWGLGYLPSKLGKTLLGIKPALEWEAPLPPTPDFKPRTAKLPAPTTLKPGFYFILASHRPDFSGNEDQVSARFIWVSELALVLRPRTDGAPHTGLVLQGDSGEPVPGARVRLWQRENSNYTGFGMETLTDSNGCFSFPSTNSPILVLAEHGKQTVATTNEVHAYSYTPAAESKPKTFFFTDRELYRPGQLIHYKGLTIHQDRKAGNYGAEAGCTVIVVFNDANGQEISRATHQTNDYGSFSGVFTAPVDRLTGTMSLKVLDQAGQTQFSVEEYKRPKFQARILQPETAVKLGEPVRVRGSALAYTGAPLGGAKVRWRIERSVRCAAWCWWWTPPSSKAIAHGSTLSDLDGSFAIDFTAAPDLSVPEGNEPVFRFSLHADVTDSTGETHSADQYLNIGYTALQATLQAAEWQESGKPVEFILNTGSLDGAPLSASGRLSLHSLRQPDSLGRPNLDLQRHWWNARPKETELDPMNPESWESGQLIEEKPFQTNSEGKASLSIPLRAGIYRACLETSDAYGKKVTARQIVKVLDPSAGCTAIRLPNLFAAPRWSLQPGDTFKALWATGHDKGRAFVELESNGKLLGSYWTSGKNTQELIALPVTEALRGGFNLRVTYVRENRAYFNQHLVSVPWTNKDLTLRWESFRSKLLPGQKETWTAVVTGPDAARASVEMVAALYDASLDQIRPHSWPVRLGGFRQEHNQVLPQFTNQQLQFAIIYSWPAPKRRDELLHYRKFPLSLLDGSHFGDELIQLSPFEVSSGSDRGYRVSNTLAGTRLKSQMRGTGAPARPAPDQTTFGGSAASMTPDLLGSLDSTQVQEMLAGPGNEGRDLNSVATRSNLSETAFFFPHLVSDSDGVVRLVFTMPEALTEWKFLGFAHDSQLRTGFLTEKVVTSKDLMVEPNPPRFLREGDQLEFTVKVSNRGEALQTGTVRLSFLDTASGSPVDALLGNAVNEQAFSVPAGQARSYSWRLKVPEKPGVLSYRAVAASAEFSDGEEGVLPVLSRRVLVTESLPLSIRGASTGNHAFESLLNSGSSSTLQSQSLTVQMSSQPAWYAVMALPYLMEFPHECSEQLFNRFYANALASHIAKANPKIRRVFEQWRNTPAEESPLQKNQQLKSVLIEETPWLREAVKETEARKNLGLLFDESRLAAESSKALRNLAERQLKDGHWSWFPAGWGNDYITLYITTGFGRLRHLGMDVDLKPAIRGLRALDSRMLETYRRILRHNKPGEYVPDHTDALYLYGRSFFLQDLPLEGESRAAAEFFQTQARRFWPQVGSRQSKAQLALALQRFGDQETALAIMKSLKEYSVNDPELGMFWSDKDHGWWWYQAPIETQALMIEAFSEVSKDRAAVEACQIWLLRQKQTQNWRTTKATADAIYSLLLGGEELLASEAITQVSLAGTPVPVENLEAGTGYYEKTYVRSEITPGMGRVQVTKTDSGLSWGGVHWQYLEELSKVKPHQGTPLKLRKTLWVRESTTKGRELRPVNGPVNVGDELIVRLELSTEQAMEFVHLKDQRGSGTEPVNVLSRHMYQDGLSYYESTRDTATHFFIDRLPKGVYVFEYPIRVQLKGRYQTGLAEIQCMYAPEFNSHSESFLLEVN